MKAGERNVRLKDLQATAAVCLVLVSGVTTTPGFAQQQTAPPQTVSNPTAAAPAAPIQNDTTGNSGLPPAPAPKLTQPLFLRDTGKDYGRPKSHFWNPLAPYTATNVPLPRLGNTPALDDLLKDGKIYLSLSEAITLALENNYDIAIARINLDIADTDLLRAKAGSTAARRLHRSGDRHPGRRHLNHHRRRRTRCRRHLHRYGRRRHRRGWTRVKHKWRSDRRPRCWTPH